MSVRDQIETIIVNNETAVFEQNTASFNFGLGEKNVQNFAKGEGQTEVVVANNVSTQLGKVMFSMPNDTTSIEQARTWAENTTNLVQIIFQSGKIYTLEDAVLNSPDIGGGSDTNIDIEFVGGTVK